MNIEDFLEEIEEILDAGKSSAFSDRVSVDAGSIRTVIEDIRLNMPDEIRQAKIIASERREIINKAKRESQALLSDSESKRMVSRRKRWQ